MAPSLAIVIPALDEADNIGSLVEEIFDHGHQNVVVVDNGSTDATARLAYEAGATVISEPRRGYGYACAAGSAEAAKAGAAVIVFMDADHSCRVDEIELLTAPIAAGEADLVLGSRVLGSIEGGAMPAHQRFGNCVSAAVMRLLYATDMTDLGPFRAIRAETLATLEMTEMTYGWPTEMTVKSIRIGAHVVEVPVTWMVRSRGRSKVSGTLRGSVLAAYHILRVTARYARGRRSRITRCHPRGRCRSRNPRNRRSP